MVANKLQPLDIPFAFVGGAAMCLLVDDPQSTHLRDTQDVDVVVEIVTYFAFSKMEERLRRAGFRHDITPGSPIVRWIVDGCVVDIMPQESSVLGMNSRWFPDVLRLAELKNLGDGGPVAKCVSPPIFLATKFEAHNDRGKADLYLSHDLEDIITLVGGYSRIVGDVDALANTAPEARKYIVDECERMVRDPYFPDAIIGHLPRLHGAKAQDNLVFERFRQISGLPDVR